MGDKSLFKPMGTQFIKQICGLYQLRAAFLMYLPRSGYPHGGNNFGIAACKLGINLLFMVPLKLNLDYTETKWGDLAEGSQVLRVKRNLMSQFTGIWYKN